MSWHGGELPHHLFSPYFLRRSVSDTVSDTAILRGGNSPAPIFLSVIGLLVGS